MEYNVCQDDIRKSEEKYVYNQEGLPVGVYSIFFTVINKVKIESAVRFSVQASSLHFIQRPRRYRICRHLYALSEEFAQDYPSRFQASSAHSDRTTWPGNEAGDIERSHELATRNGELAHRLCSFEEEEREIGKARSV